MKCFSACAPSGLLGRTTRIVEHRQEEGTESIYVTNVKILLNAKEQAVKAGTVVSTSRRYIHQTNQEQKQSSIFMRVIKTRSHRPLSNNPGPAAAAGLLRPLTLCDPARDIHAIFPSGPIMGNKTKPSSPIYQSSTIQMNASLSVSICLGCCLWKYLESFFIVFDL